MRNIVRLLLDNKDGRFTIRQISRELKINYRTAYDSVERLEKEGYIKTERIGSSRLVRLTYRYGSLVYDAEKARMDNLGKNFRVLHDRLACLPFPFIALLFGSHVKGTDKKHSDIDILTIGDHEKELAQELRLLPENIHHTHVSYKDFIQMARSSGFSVITEAIKANIILIGIEEYYRLLSNAGYEEI